ncbi:putative zinc-binding peptidase [Roseomonas sp. OT10]|uniref:zinc-binding metallopeptidase family protein n=1 Tax=Roseomonas cutis TaxID=2897332 RepID=UPI001E32F53A|nr:putative zinc-binding peptidase [Roseomonas sp. OT10]UFN49628.1 putative zinc-binding peptidase [Roseomonas sp. OT10]
MRLFKCQSCGQALYFENTRCESCGHRLGYLPDLATLSALEDADGAWQPLAQPSGPRLFCTNVEHGVCNWTVPADSGEAYCAACRHNHTIPDTTVTENLENWQKLEFAKHRLFYTLLRFCLPLQTRAESPTGLAFDFLSDPADGGKVMTGHDDGLITIRLKEADDAERERLRKELGEPYRTLLGHFRHEVGHYFWDRLVQDAGRLDECRAVFGDDSQDYAEALKTHYAQGAPADWQMNFVSNYASAHPWEDFAETWAHYLHIIDTLETAAAFGLSINPRIDKTGDMSADITFDPYKEKDFNRIIEAWLPLAFAVNSLNRSMGQPDLYPFVLSPVVIDKLRYIHELIRSSAVSDKAAPEPEDTAPPDAPDATLNAEPQGEIPAPA